MHHLYELALIILVAVFSMTIVLLAMPFIFCSPFYKALQTRVHSGSNLNECLINKQKECYKLKEKLVMFKKQFIRLS